MDLGLFTAAGLLALRIAPVRSRAGRVGVSAGLVASVALIVILASLPTDTGRAVSYIWTAVLLLLMVLVLIRQILVMPTVTLQSIYGAVSAYLIIGLMFSAIYAATYYLDGRIFFARNEAASEATFQYFSFTTLTTLGYGDFTPAQSGGQAIAMIEAMTGQIFLATLVARLVAAFRPASQNGRPTGADDDQPAD